MKKMKLLILLFIPIMITGCSVDYDVLINTKKEVVETIKFIRKNDDILTFNDSINIYLSSLIDSYKREPSLTNYRFNKKQGNIYSYILLNRRHESLEGYKQTPLFQYLFEDANIIKNDEYTIFKTVGEYYYNNLYGESEGIDPNFHIEGVNIKFKFYNNIIESNADDFDKKTNTLTWNLTANDLEKYIYFKIGNQKKYDIIVMDFVIKNQGKIIGILIATVLLSIVSIYLYFKVRKGSTI
ncbi:MAG: hypothetical protein PHW90_02760 [Bacilli bacterium]|nr:hypothetical protein [Bacilli bacterium]